YHKYALATKPGKLIYSDYTDGALTHFNQEDDQDPNPPLHFDSVENNPGMTQCAGKGPKSPRASGILVGLCDGSSRHVAAAIFNSTTWQNACRRADGNTLVGNWNE